VAELSLEKDGLALEQVRAAEGTAAGEPAREAADGASGELGVFAGTVVQEKQIVHDQALHLARVRLLARLRTLP
jgi:hypothetical protein